MTRRTFKGRWRAVGIGAASVATAAVTFAQGAQQPVFRAAVDLVHVEVVVVDGVGQPVRGLTKESFRIVDRRQPQTVSVFEEVTRDPASIAAPVRATAARPDIADNRTATSQRLVVLLIDDLHLDRPREDRAKALAKEVVEKVGAGASMAVLFTSGTHGTEITEDRGAILTAVESLKAQQAERRPLSVPETPGGRGNSGQEFFQNIQGVKTLSDAARMLSSDDIRRKTFVMISEGVNKQMNGMFDFPETPCEAHPPQQVRAGQQPVVPCGASMALHQMMEDMRRANVSMYIVDPRGAVSDDDLDKENFPPPGPGVVGVAARGRTGQTTRPQVDSHLKDRNPVRIAQTGLNIMAEASGGFAVTNSNDFDAGIQLIADDLNHYYLLGFSPTDPNGTEYRTIGVSIAGHPDWTLRFRRGYLPGGPPAPPANSDPLISGVTPKTDLPLRLIAIAQPSTKTPGNAQVSLVLEVAGPKAQLVDAQGLIHDDVSFQIVAVLTKKGQAVARVANSAKLTLKAGPTVAASEGAPYTIPAGMDLTPGSYQLRASATSGQSHLAGSVYLNLEVPDFSSAPLSIGGVALGYADGAHVAMASSETPQTDLSLPFIPTLDRTFSAKDTLRVYAEVPRTNLNDAVKMTVAVTADPGGKMGASAVSNIGPAEHGRVDTTLPLSSLAPGAYTLTVTANDGQHTATREIPIVIK